MIISLTDKHKHDLSFLKDQQPQMILQFVQISIQFLEKGENPTMYSAAAKKLETSIKQISSVIEALSHIFAQAARFSISDGEFLASLAVLGFSQDLNEQLKSLYLDHKEEIRSIQKNSSLGLPHYNNLDWRLDAQISSRCLASQVQPIFTLRLDTTEQGKEKSQFFQVDYGNLKHMTEELEQAIKEIKSSHCKRIMRNI